MTNATTRMRSTLDDEHSSRQSDFESDESTVPSPAKKNCQRNSRNGVEVPSSEAVGLENALDSDIISGTREKEISTNDQGSLLQCYHSDSFLSKIGQGRGSGARNRGSGTRGRGTGSRERRQATSQTLSNDTRIRKSNRPPARKNDPLFQY